MKKLFYKILAPVWLLAASLTGCSDVDVASLAEVVPMTMSVNTTSFAMGDSLVVTFEVDGRGVTANEDINIYLTAASGSLDYSDSLFTDFPDMITLPKGEYTLTKVIHVVEEGLTSTISLDFSAFARGYTITNSSQAITVFDYYRTTMSIQNNADRTVNEGTSFTLLATVGKAVEEDVIIEVTLPTPTFQYEVKQLVDGVITPTGTIKTANYFDDSFPLTLTVKKGETTGTATITAYDTADEDSGDRTAELKFSTTSVDYPLSVDTMAVTILDLDFILDPAARLTDERWVYRDPTQAFVSSNWQNAVTASGVTNTRLMTRGADHPNATSDPTLLSNWKFYSAIEFHYLPDNTRMYTTLSDAGTNNIASNVLFPRCFGSQTTAAVQRFGYVDNAACTKIMEDGYFRMITLYDADARIVDGGVTSNNSTKQYLTSAIYMSSFRESNQESTGWASNWIYIYPGMRVEIRARIRGEGTSGLIPGIWFQGNKQNSNDGTWNQWPTYGEVDVLEVNDYSGSGRPGYAEQTYHTGTSQSNQVNPTIGTKFGDDIENWQVYWMEWEDASTVSMGINGTKTITLTSSQVTSQGYKWPFDYTANPKGMYFLLTMMFLNNESTQYYDGRAINNITYTQAMSSESTAPRMEIDWIRFYTDGDPDDYDATVAAHTGWGDLRNTNYGPYY